MSLEGPLPEALRRKILADRDAALQELPEVKPSRKDKRGKMRAAVELGKRGGIASRRAQTAEERSAQARKAAEARWGKR